MPLFKAILLPLVLLNLPIDLASSADKAAPEQPPVTRLKLVAATLPAAVFKYQLLPPFLEQTSGNAASGYYRAITLLNSATSSPQKTGVDRDGQFAKWLEMPIQEMPREDVRQALTTFRSVLEELRAASRRDRCDWDLPIRGNENVVDVVLPEVQQLRALARILALQTRLEMLEGRYDQALDLLQTGFAMSRHVAEMPFLISCLVGVALSNIASDRILEWGQLPAAPSLYWPLTALPQPLIDFNAALQVEMVTPYQMFPFLQNPDRTERTPEQWNSQFDQMLAKLAKYDESAVAPSRLTRKPLVLSDFPEVKPLLEQLGFSAVQVEQMPVSRAVAIYTSHTYDALRDDLFKWFPVPFPQARHGMAQALAALKDGPRKEIIPLAGLLLPAIDNVNLAAHRAARRTAELRLIEALRLYAAAHGGRLPDRLDEITDVPVPRDPLTGNAFPYRRDGNKAVIELEVPKGLSGQQYGRRYEISIRSE